VNLRIAPRTRDLIDSAAATLGKTRTEFMVDLAREEAINVLLDRRLFILSEEQHEAFMRVLDNPPAAGPKLRALMQRQAPWEK
jgi:uncharacterized protein (DUF1778 family)